MECWDCYQPGRPVTLALPDGQHLPGVIHAVEVQPGALLVEVDVPFAGVLCRYTVEIGAAA